jgi:hypothetical protein
MSGAVLPHDRWDIEATLLTRTDEDRSMLSAPLNVSFEFRDAGFGGPFPFGLHSLKSEDRSDDQSEERDSGSLSDLWCEVAHAPSVPSVLLARDVRGSIASYRDR